MDKLLQLMTLLVMFCSPQNIHSHEQGMMEKHNNPSGESFKQHSVLRQDKGLAPRYSKKGKGSWYGAKFHGNLTKYGDVFDMNKVSFAHNTLPPDTLIKVTNLKNGLSVVGPVTDTGSFGKKYGRIVDLSREAMKRIGGLRDGVVPVRVEVVRYPRAT